MLPEELLLALPLRSLLQTISQAADDLQQRCPTISPRQLEVRLGNRIAPGGLRTRCPKNMARVPFRNIHVHMQLLQLACSGRPSEQPVAEATPW